MADGVGFNIDIMAQATGVDASASQVNNLASALQSTAGTATSFDAAMQAASAQLASAREATASAAAALKGEEKAYDGLAKAAAKTASELDKVSMAGGDTSKLQADADRLKAKMTAQAAAVDAAAAALKKCKAAEDELADSSRTLARAQAESVAEQKREPEVMKRALGPYGEKLERLKAMKESFGLAGMAGIGAAAVWLVAAAALVAIATAAASAVWELAKFAVTSNPKAMAAYNKQLEAAQKGIKSLFKDVRVGGFTSAMGEVLSVFKEGSAEAEGMKLLVETLLNPLFDAAKVVGPYVKELFRGMLWACLEAATAVVLLRNAVLRAIPPEVRAAIREVADQVDWVKVAFYGGAAAAVVLAVAVGVLAAIVAVGAAIIGGVLFLAVMVVIAPFLLFAVVIGVVIAAIIGIGYAIAAAVDYLGTLASSAADAASNLISSFVGQIQNGVGMVADAMRAMGSGAIDALKSALGIASPSKFALAMASNVTETFSGKVEDETGAVQGAMTGLVPDVVGAGAGAADGGVRGGSLTLHIKVNDGPQQSIKAPLEGLLTLILEGDALQMGAA